ncbi:MAG: hypothetical protein AAFY19_05115 [Pseudomonadota bacterium]
MEPAKKLFPASLIERATLRGNEYAWRIEDIPTVIEAARAANLVNIGGQLQFRITNGGTCECYWVNVDTYKDVSKGLPWPERVTLTATSALRQFHRLVEKFDFIAEGRQAFAQHLLAFEAQGGDLNETLCFVWYVKSEQAAESP